MKNDVFDVVLLLALPASGKSEVRNFMINMDPEVLRRDFHIGQNLQLDDFPYVHIKDRIEEELKKMGKTLYPRACAGNGNGVLIKLLNEDYKNLVENNKERPESYARLMFDRLDKAAKAVDDPYLLSSLDKETYEKLIELLEDDCKAQFEERLSFYPEDGKVEGKTVVIEMARGGKDGSSMPLQDPAGYQYSLRMFSPEILERAAILYIWVTPEESRRKNFERTDPNDPGSILNHGVPLQVMLDEYGCDDMLYLKDTSEVKDTITVTSEGKKFHLPIGIFDNRVDKTTHFRQDPSKWQKENIEEVTKGIQEATDIMYKNYKI